MLPPVLLMGLAVYPQLARLGPAVREYPVGTDGPADVLKAAVAALPHDDHGQPTTMDRVLEGWVKILADVRG